MAILPGKYIIRILKVLIIPLMIIIIMWIGGKSSFQKQEILDILSAQGLLRDSGDGAIGRQLKVFSLMRCTESESKTWIPSASVIITCDKTEQSVLFGAIHSIVDNSPVKYLKEILIAPYNKQSELTELKASIKATWPDGIVRVIDPDDTLYHARKHGVELAKGDVLVFMDSHTLVAEGWLEPLLAAIGNDPKLVAAPVIGHLDKVSMTADADDVMMPGFFFNFTLNWRQLTDAETANFTSDPPQQIRTPVISGEVFAIDKKNLATLGYFQDEMYTVGIELEFSFRTWMCGGRIAIIPCSRVNVLAHAQDLDDKVQQSVQEKAMIQIAEVWMDKYRRMFYMYRKKVLEEPYGGDLAQKYLMKIRKKCRPFSWYIENVYRDKFIPDQNVYAWGLVRNPASKKCLTSAGSVRGNTSSHVDFVNCDHRGNMDQAFSLTFEGMVRQEETRCLASRGTLNSSVYIGDCNADSEEVLWYYTAEDCVLVNRVQSLCLTVVDPNHLPVLQPCVEYENNAKIALRQKWTFQHYLKKELKFWE